MKQIMVSVYDSAAEAFMRPFATPAEGQAIRQFIDEVRDTESPMHRHPGDYSLVRVGYFLDHSGELIPDYKQLLKGIEALQTEPVVPINKAENS